MSKTRELKPRKETNFTQSMIVMVLTVVILIGGCILGLQYRYLMLAVAIVAGVVNVFVLHIPWHECEEAVASKMKSVIPTLCLMWCTGAMIAVMIYCGSVPMVIYYGFMIISPKFIYVSAFLLCLIMSTLTGSSWTSAGTAGLAMYGLAIGMDAEMVIVVGAIVAGSIFGDKVSPLSETTNMAPACAGTTLYAHIGSMMYDTLPAAVVSAIVFTIAGVKLHTGEVATDESIDILMNNLDEVYNFNILLLLPFVLILYAAFAKKPVIPIMVIDIFLCILLGIVCQQFTLTDGMEAAYSGFTLDMAQMPESFEPSDFLVTILERGGSASMVGVVFMCFTGFGAAAMISKGGFLDCVMAKIVTNINSRVGCVAAALLTNLIIMVATGTAYVAFIMVSEMYKKAFLKNRVGLQVLSRCLEDVGTCFGCLIPWSLSGSYYATLFDNMPIWGEGGYAFWTVLPYTGIIFAFICAFTGIGMYKLSDEEAEAKLKELEEENA